MTLEHKHKWKEEVVTCMEVLLWHSSGETGEDRDKHQSS